MSPVSVKPEHHRTDAQLKHAVLRELEWDTRVVETDVGVQVDDGIVTLTGTVGSWAERTAVQKAAHRVSGVLDVVNDVRVAVRGSAAARTDTEIAHAVRHALEWDVLVPDTRIRSTVSDGIVTLEGDVECFSHREDAERAIRNLAGVRGVSNRIAVRPAEVVEVRVRDAIEAALERRAEREAKRITVDLEEGHVTLRGVVRSWAEREAVLGAAKGTPGVRSVDSRLRIEEGPHR